MKRFLYKPSTSLYKPIQAKIYVQDPAVAPKRGGGLTTIRIPGEAYLGAGPTSSRVEVVDYDESTRTTHPPAEPLQRGGGFAVGRGDPAKSFRHHQVNAWAIITRTLGILELPTVLGRRIPWGFPGGRLRVYPHAHREENAFYDRDTGSLNLCYFDGARPGTTIYTCLSHDIITHELGHAVLDGLKPLYNELDSPDVAGFHEYFGDALAMASSLTMKEVVKAVVRGNPKRLAARNIVSDIALEFGSKGVGHQPLRSAANRRTFGQLRNNWEEHDYSEVLTGAFHDLLLALYADVVPREQARLKKKRVDGQVAVGALVGSANRTVRMMLRALDYCPPVGLTYGDYASAILRADEVAYPIDGRGYRRKAAQILRARGILQGRSATRLNNNDLRDYDVDRLSATRTDAYVFVDANREAFHVPREANFEIRSLYRTRKVSSEGFYPPREVVVEFVWPHDVPVRGRDYGPLDGETLPLWCGGTLVFDSDGNILHVTVKTAGRERITRLKSYLRYLVREGAFQDELAVRQAEGYARIVRVAQRRHAGRKGYGSSPRDQ
jgi:hypothetical protein